VKPSKVALTLRLTSPATLQLGTEPSLVTDNLDVRLKRFVPTGEGRERQIGHFAGDFPPWPTELLRESLERGDAPVEPPAR
jgi:hypothetical protein